MISERFLKYFQATASFLLAFIALYYVVGLHLTLPGSPFLHNAYDTMPANTGLGVPFRYRIGPWCIAFLIFFSAMCGRFWWGRRDA